MKADDCSMHLAPQAAEALGPALGALADAVAPLQAALVWVTYQGLAAQNARGTAPVEAVWSQAQHTAALGALSAPALLGEGLWAERVDDAIVVRRVPVVAQRVEGLIDDGFLSGLAGRTLAAALELGYNLVWTGPQMACERAMLALAAHGARPAVWARPKTTAVPQGFVAVDDAALVWRGGIDRLVASSSATPAALGMLTNHTSAQAWVPAGRLERALMRLELASGAVASEAAVHLLAAVDFIIVVAAGPNPHVAQVAELRLVDSGYRPALVFSTGQAIAPEALAPVEAPSFVTALSGLGEQALADDWNYASASSRPGPAPSAPPVTQAPPQAPPAPAAYGPRASSVSRPRSKAPPAPAPGLGSQPGWELDRLLAMQPEDEAAEGLNPAEASFNPAHTAEAAEAASLAAQFGLGPPPPPRQRPQRPSNFSDALAFVSGVQAPKSSAPADRGPAHALEPDPLGLEPKDADAGAEGDEG